MADLASAWTQFCKDLEDAGQLVLAQGASRDELDRAEGLRYLTRLARGMLYSSFENADPDRPRLQLLDLVKVGADNPDNVYLSATIRGDRVYRIRGERGSIAYVSFGTKANRYAVDGTMASTGELSVDDLDVQPDGSVEIVVSADPRPGNWLPMAPDTTGLVVRQTFLDRESEEPGRWTIERVPDLGPAPPLDARAVSKALHVSAAAVRGTASTFIKWSELFATRPNELVDFGQEMFQRSGGDPEIHYLHGYWRLAEDEAWVIRTKVPDCPYWNFQLDNWWMESLDHDRRMTVNKHTATLDEDGSLTIVVAAADPGVANWIETAGHSHGTALLRWLGAADHPVPTCEVIPIRDLVAQQ